jgi:hypothetical protein
MTKSVLVAAVMAVMSYFAAVLLLFCYMFLLTWTKRGYHFANLTIMNRWLLFPVAAAVFILVFIVTLRLK